MMKSIDCKFSDLFECECKVLNKYIKSIIN